jgi:Tol biopolymer transport system component
MVPTDTNGQNDVYVRDRLNGITERVSVSSTGNNGNGGTFDGAPIFSADGRFVVFESGANNLVAGDTNGDADVFVRDRLNGITERVSLSSTGTQIEQGGLHPSISADGRFVAFRSFDNNVVPGDTHPGPDVFVRDLVSDTTEWVSPDTGAGPPFISANGRYVVFISTGPLSANDVFVYDRTTDTTDQVTFDAPAHPHSEPSISADGRYVASKRFRENDELPVYDVYVHDRANAISQRVSESRFFNIADLTSFELQISEDGRYVVFGSHATNLVRNDTNERFDVFLRFALRPGPLTTTGATAIARGTTGQITLNGSWFDPAALQVYIEPRSGITLDQIAVQDPNKTVVLTVTVAANAPTGSRDIFVINPGNPWDFNAGGGENCGGCLIVT